MRRWLERSATAAVLAAAIGLLLACWAPAYVGATPWERPRHRRADPPPRPPKPPATPRR